MTAQKDVFDEEKNMNIDRRAFLKAAAVDVAVPKIKQALKEVGYK